MRTDKQIAAAFADPHDLRALLLGSSQRELGAIRNAADIGHEADPDAIAAAIERLIEVSLPGNARGPQLLNLALWAVKQAGCTGSPETLEEADIQLVRHVRGASVMAQGETSSAHSLIQLLKIAVAIAHLRQRKLRRLSMWRPWLDRLIGVKPVRTSEPVTHTDGPADDGIERMETEPDGEILWDTIRNAGGHLPLSVWEDRLSEARKELGRFNIIVAGRTGVGKTTLIGAIFGEEIGDTLMGRPRTRGRIWYPLEPGEADILRLCDTEGLEMERYEETLGGLKREIESRNASSDPFDHVHVAWLCIDEPSLTVQPGEEALAAMLSREGIPVIAVLTKAGMAPAFKETVEALLPAAKAVIRVRAAPIDIEGQTFPKMGLDLLMRETEDAIPSAVEAAWHVASRNLEANLRRSETLVRRAAGAAGAAGAMPIPIADAAGVFGVQVGMIVGVSLNMGVKLKRSDLQAMAVTLLGALGLTAGGRFIAGQVAKLIPGLGTIAGSAITGTAAATLTYGLGRAYIAYLRGFFEKNKRMPDADELTVGFRSYWSQWKNKHESLPETR